MDDNIIREVVNNNFGYPSIRFSCPEKTKATYSIVKSKDGFMFLEIVVDSGTLPQELEGKFSREIEAEKKIITYLRNRKPTPIVRRDQNAAERAAKKADKED